MVRAIYTRKYENKFVYFAAYYMIFGYVFILVDTTSSW